MVRHIPKLLIIIIIITALSFFIFQQLLLNVFKGFFAKKIGEAIGADVKIGAIWIGFPLQINVRNAKILNKDDKFSKRELAKIPSVSFSISPLALLGKRIVLSAVNISSPAIFIQRTSKNEVNIAILKKNKAGAPTKPKQLSGDIKSLNIKGAKVEIFDERIAQPAFTFDLDNLNVSITDYPIGDVAYKTGIKFKTTVKAKNLSSDFSADGWADLKEKDMDASINLSNFNLVAFHPYYKQFVPNINSGNLDFSAKIISQKNALVADCKLLVRNLSIPEQAGQEQILGVSAKQLLSYIQDSKGEILMEFQIKSEFDNPAKTFTRFKEELTTQALRKAIEKQAQQLIEKLGRKVLGIPEAGQGQEPAQPGKGTPSPEKAGEELQKIFEGIFKQKK